MEQRKNVFQKAREAFMASRNEEQIESVAVVQEDSASASNDILSTISYDIRTPLNSILGMLEIIKSHENVPEKTRVALRKIEDSARYLANITNEVFDLNEIENSRFELHNEKGDLKEFVEDLSVLVQSTAKNNDIAFSVRFENLVDRKVRFSRINLQRVLVNLISNGIKYNNPGGKVDLIVEEIEAGDNSGTYRFVVEDNGIGMSEDFQNHMFDSFEQENVDANKNNESHGLGLAIVKKIVDKMHGNIEVESEKDKGTRITVILELKLAEKRKEKAPKKSAKTVKAPEITDLTGVKILVVEDNTLNMEIAETLLSAAGAEVTTAVNGKRAVEQFTGSAVGHFNVILMDVLMPIMDGLDATRKIRSLKREDAKTVPIIAMTAKTMADDIKMCLEAGMNEHVAKPIEINLLIAKIGQYVKKTADISK